MKRPRPQTAAAFFVRKGFTSRAVRWLVELRVAAGEVVLVGQRDAEVGCSPRFSMFVPSARYTPEPGIRARVPSTRFNPQVQIT
jgi:hypothetical protein